MQISIVGVGWYREEDYPAIFKIMEDRHVLPATFKIWHESAQRLERQVKAGGKRAHRAIIDPKTFPGWCALRGLKVNAEGRMAFANQDAYKTITGQ